MIGGEALCLGAWWPPGGPVDLLLLELNRIGICVWLLLHVDIVGPTSE